jgi:hypothetical protein
LLSQQDIAPRWTPFVDANCAAKRHLLNHDSFRAEEFTDARTDIDCRRATGVLPIIQTVFAAVRL